MNKFKLIASAIIALIIATIITVFVLVICYDRKVWTITLIIVAVVLINVSFGIYILNSQRHIYTKACWLFCIILLPLVGCFFFVVFGTLPMSRKDWRAEIINQAKFNKYENYDFTKQYLLNHHEDATNIFHYNYRNLLKPIYAHNTIYPIANNTAILENTVRLIRQANHFIHFETFIIHDGFFFRVVMAELIKKAQAGIKVRFLYDWFGGFCHVKKKQIKELKANGVEVGIFNPPGFNMFKGATNYRLHRKALIVDNKYALYGGSNIGDEYLSMSKQQNYWRDQNFLLEGEIVNSINIAFINDWISFTDYSVTHEQKDQLMNRLGEYLVIHKATTTINMQLCNSAPNFIDKEVMNTMSAMILRAKKSIQLVTPYFVPTELCSSALNIAARSGVNVKIIVPGKPDNKNFIVTVNRGQYPELLNMSCEVYEYDGFIHSKYLIVDDEYVFITTANFDYRSFWHNFESGIIVQSVEFNQQMKNIFAEEISNSKQINLKMAKTFLNLTARLRLMVFNLYKPLL